MKETKLKDKPLKYDEIKVSIIRAMERGELAPGSRLPPERKLAEMFNCNYHTVRHALKKLKEIGLIERRVGSGTFVVNRADTVAGTEKFPEPVKNLLGVIFMPRLADEYAWKILEHLNNQAARMDVRLELRMISALDAAALDEVKNMRQMGCAAVIIPWFGSQPTTVLQQFVRASCLPVTLPDLVPGLELNCFQEADKIGSGEDELISLESRYLLAMGVSRVALLGPERANTIPFQRQLMSYSRFVNTHDLEAVIGLVDDGLESMERLVERWRSKMPGLGVVVYDATLALRLIDVLGSYGLRVPGDVAVISGNDSAESFSGISRLTSIKTQYWFFSEHMIRHAMASARGEVAQATCTTPISIIARETCGEKNKSEAELRAIMAEIQV